MGAPEGKYMFMGIVAVPRPCNAMVINPQPKSLLAQKEIRLLNFPDCVTLIVRVIPPPLMVMVAVRELNDEFSVAVTVIVPLFEPEEDDNESHEELTLTVQLTLALMENDSRSPEDEKFSDASDTVIVSGIFSSCGGSSFSPQPVIINAILAIAK